MTDKVQKIADAVVRAYPGLDGDANRAALYEAIRQALGSTQERGEAVAPVMWQYRVYHTDPDDSGWGLWHDCHDASTATRLQSSEGYQVRHLYAAPTDAQSRIAELEAQLALAYGLLWHVNAGMDAPHGTPSLTPERGAMESRKILRDLLTHEQRGDGINAARNYMAALAAEKEQK